MYIHMYMTYTSMNVLLNINVWSVIWFSLLTFTVVKCRTLYVESMGRTIHNLFKCYCAQLSKLDLVLANKNDLIVVEEASLKSMFSQKVCGIYLSVVLPPSILS
jgi:hypothetical protein